MSLNYFKFYELVINKVKKYNKYPVAGPEHKKSGDMNSSNNDKNTKY